MVYTKEASPVEIITEGSEQILKINYEDKPYVPSIEGNSLVMMDAIDRLVENPSTSRITFSQKRNYSYNYDQTKMLIELANIYSYFVKSRRATSLQSLGLSNDTPELLGQRLSIIQFVMLTLLKQDPLGAYAELKRVIRRETINLKTNDNFNYKNSLSIYLKVLNDIFSQLDKTLLIEQTREYLPGFTPGDREVYRLIFKPTITPDFMFTKIQASLPLDGEQLAVYKINDSTEVNLFRTPNEIKPLYHITPPEFKISEDKFELIDLAKKVLSEHQPRADEFLEPEKMRSSFTNISKDLLRELAEQKGTFLSSEEIDEMAEILVRNTVGFGVVELLLADEKIQDLTINSPMGQVPIFLIHEDFNECTTNIIPTTADFESWATKFRLLSGRPLDEANPILDTEVILPNARSRLSIIGKPLNPYGYGMSFRRHRDTPWTLPLFIKNKMISPLGAGLLSFTIDGARSHLIAGTRSSGKTSFLTSLLLDISRKYRILTIEDTLEIPTDAMRELGYNVQPLKVRSALVKGGSEIPADEGIRTSLRLGDSALIVGEVRSSIRGNEKVFIIDNGKTERVTIKDLEGRDISEMYVPTMDIDLKFKLKKVIAFVKHPKREKLLEVTTKTGRKVTVTPDHSLFTHKDFRIIPIECKDLAVGSKIIIPERIPCGYNNIQKINIMELLEDKDCRLKGYEDDLKQMILKIGWKKASEIANTSADIYVYLRKGIQHSNIPISTFKQLAKEAGHEYAVSSLQIKKGTSKTLNAEIEISKDFCRFLGYYASEGYTQENRSVVVFSNGNPIIMEDIVSLSKNLFNVNTFVRETEGLGISTQISLCNKVLGLLLNKLGCGRIATEKRVPSFIFGLSEDRICEFLKGYFDGDGCQLASESSGNAISASTVSKDLADDIVHLLLCLGIVARIEKKSISNIGKHEPYIVIFKQRNYIKIFLEKVGFKKYAKAILERQTSHSSFNTVDYDPKILEEHVKIKRDYRHLRRCNSCGKDYLKKVVNNAEWSSDRIKFFVNGEFYLDEVQEIKEINLNKSEYVYDLSVEPCQNFIGGFGGIMLHNTEALALYEAMRIGASANVVAGTIHGDSPYGVFDRVVNDLKVPKTSFKATDLIIMCNPIRSADGMKKFRRVTSITEVRKTWEEDPLAERGFIDLMKYNAKTDMLEPTPELINGDSEVLKAIGANVREWVGNWDAIWDNIVLRGELKKMIVEYSDKLKMPELLEAEFCLQGNDQFYRITGQVQSEVGPGDVKRIKFEWEEWLKREIRKKQI